ncbi:MAG: LamG-like jellyroll fold domain-containing protein [Bacteroidota bacterium]|nr:LamG-like jellyroll fold domain-containing protein [Bacteroidota bacterium]
MTSTISSSIRGTFLLLFQLAFVLHAAAIPSKEIRTTQTVSQHQQKAGLTDIPGVDRERLTNRTDVLKLHGRAAGSPAFSTFTYSFNLLPANDYQAQKPADAFAFEAGFVSADGTINISEPITADQRAVFPDLTSVALFYLNQSYLYHYYQTRNMPLLFKVGFPLFESGLLPPDSVVRKAINAYGGSFASFDVLNNHTTFMANNGLAIAAAFGEFMNVFKNWGYPMVTNLTADSFDVLSYWHNVDNLAGLLGDFNRYVYHRFLQPDDNQRIRLFKESDHFKYYTSPYFGDINFPMLFESMEAAYAEYVDHYQVTAGEKLSLFTLGDCVDADIEGVSCDPATATIGGTAWSSGLHAGCTSKPDDLNSVKYLMRHELAHLFQGLWQSETGTAWLGEGFAFFNAEGPLAGDYLGLSGFSYRPLLLSSMDFATRYFGHCPAYADTKEYPQTDYGYKYLGYSMIDFMYRKGGYVTVKNVQINDTAGYQALGYPTAQAFFEDYLYDFDTRVKQLPVATLLNPVANVEESGDSVTISWIPLKNGVKLTVFVSTDEKKTWSQIADHTADTACNWMAGNSQGPFYIKLSAPDNLDVSTTFGPFYKVSLSRLSLISPSNNQYIISNDTVEVSWGTTTVNTIRIDYTQDGTNWNTIAPETPASNGLYKWGVPDNLSGSCQLKLTDLADTNNYATSGPVTILKSNPTGGPYPNDKNTLLLLHFDNGLNNSSLQAPDAAGNMASLTTDTAGVDQLGRCYKTGTALIVPNHAALNLNGDWTIEAWVKLYAYTSNNMYLFWKPGDSDAYQSNYSLEVNPWWGNCFYGYYFSGFNSRIGVTGPAIALNEWYHVAFIRDTKSRTIQLVMHDKNRHRIFSADQPYSPDGTCLNSRDLQIGTNLVGYIDEVRISNVVRNFTSTGITQVTSDHLTVYPNPSTGIIYLSHTQGPGKIRVLDLQGRVLLTRPLSGKEQSVERKVKIDLTSFKKGLYLIQLIQDTMRSVEKVILI